jgi:hypothetical protein
LKVEFVPAVVGYERTRAGGYPIKKGVVVFREDAKKVIAESKALEAKRKDKN